MGDRICHFTQFKLPGILDKFLYYLVTLYRKRQEKEATPSLLSIDNQSFGKMQFIKEETGIDGGKNVNGRIRTILVDTLVYPCQLRLLPQIFQIIRQVFWR